MVEMRSMNYFFIFFFQKRKFTRCVIVTMGEDRNYDKELSLDPNYNPHFVQINLE